MLMINCFCGTRLEGTDNDALFGALREHSGQVHADDPFTEDEIAKMRALHARMTPWNGEQIRLGNQPHIKPVGPQDLDAFLHFFEREAFADNPLSSWMNCYCMFEQVTAVDEEWERRLAGRNREERIELIRSGRSHGYLAYADEQPVGWCNAGPRSAYPRLSTFEEAGQDEARRTGAIVCYVVAAPYRGQGIARQLLDAACEGFRTQGLALAEGYPSRVTSSPARDHRGTLEMYLAAGFTPHREMEQTVVVRKALI